MATPDLSNAERLKLVSGFYGPGAVGCWFAIIGSVLVSWTMNKTTSKTDCITNDFIAAITLPAVATGHLIYQFKEYRGEDLNLIYKSWIYRDGQWSFATAAQPSQLQRTAALEASLTICNGFAILSIILLAIAQWKGQSKRRMCIGLVNLFSYATVTALYAMSYVDDVRAARLSYADTRTLWVGTGAVLSVLVAVAMTSIVGLACWMYDGFRRHNKAASPNGKIALSKARALLRMYYQLTQCVTGVRHSSRSTRPSLSIQTLICLAITLGQSFVELALLMSLAYAIGIQLALHFDPPLPFVKWQIGTFVPRSNTKLSDLDQAVALAGGIATLAFGCWEAAQSHREVEEESSD